VNSFLAYMGGKSRLATTIIKKMPAHRCYVEVFCGAAWLLFKKDENASQVEVINDINGDLVTLYRVIKHHLEEFVRYFKWCLIARDEFNRLRAECPETLTDIQRAARFYYLLKNGYAARISSPTFTSSPSTKPRLNLLRIEEELSAVHLRLARVVIENHPYQKIFERFDRPDTLFYVDPPYYECEDYYGKGVFDRTDFEALKNILKDIKGMFILSINDTAPIRELFKEFQVEKVKTTYTAGIRNKALRVDELLITKAE
jgi:DNA adenine methylase